MVQEQDEATDQDYSKYQEQTNQIQIQKNSKNIQQKRRKTQQLIQKYERRYEKDMIAKYQKDVNNNCLVVQNDDQIINLNFADDLNVTSLTVNNCKNVKFVKVPVKVTSLAVNDCDITNINGIEAMSQLNSLDLRNNTIVLIEPLKHLTNLKQVLIDNNFIQDLEFLVNQDWICEQRAPKDINLQAYLADTNSILTLDAFKAQISIKKAKSDQLLQVVAPVLQAKYDTSMTNKFKSQVNYNKLEIISDTGVKDVKFMDQISVQCLIINKCTNFSFRMAPTQLLYLTLNDCNITDLEGLQQFKQLKKFESINNTQLTSIKQVYSLTSLLSLTINNTKINNLLGIEQLSKLQYIDLRDNCIVSIEPVKSLQFLKQVLIDNNFIQDLEHLTATKNYNPKWIYYQNAITDSELARYLTDTQQKMSLQELKTGFEQKKRRTDELIRDYPAAYDAKMKAKYQNSVKSGSGYSYGPRLRIENEQELRDLRFVSELGVTDLYLGSCQNAHLLRAPTNLRSLVHYPSGMKTAKGVERLLGLEVLSIENAQIVELNIRGLKKLNYLWVNNNKIRDMSAAEYLKAKGCCQRCYSVDKQNQPSQEEIDEARLW
ncbi:Leucine_Rich repeats-containing protein [Hexamita inflata]|uniref:Leucine Rich repeats-containing protein n=1 Tax=Hexamita inflata TaxID=28002 RepID=A0AA86TB50_9EUKA|nr:Leucine Rich repeats-containing protein [Hexamita inflata]